MNTTNAGTTGGSGVSELKPGVRRNAAATSGFLAAALLCVATIAMPNLAHAAHGGGGGGGGGFHGGGGGGFHGGGMGGFHGGGMGGFHGGGVGGFHAGGFGGFQGGGVGEVRGGGFSGGESHAVAPLGAGMDGSHAAGLRGGSGSSTVVLRGDRSGHSHHGWGYGAYGAGLGYEPYVWSDDGEYDYYGSGQSDASSYWYYCSDPAGYYPNVSQCSLPWQTVPGG